MALAVSLFVGLGMISDATAQVAVGRGSYATTLPAGQSGPSNENGNAVSPVVTAYFLEDQRIQTNDWWSSLLFKFFNDPYSAPLYAQPLAYKAKAKGLLIGYPSDANASENFYIQSLGGGDMTVSLDGLDVAQTKAAGYSDWAATASWDGQLRATMGHGFLYTYFERNSTSDVVISANGSFDVWSDGDYFLGVTINGHHYGIFGPAGSDWTTSAGALRSDLAGKEYFSVALLPEASASMLKRFRRRAYAFVTDTKVHWDYDETTAELTTTFAFETTPKETGGDLIDNTLVALYRHQQINLTDAGSAKLTSQSYQSVEGPMPLLEGKQFTTAMTFHGMVPQFPDLGARHDDEMYRYVDDLYNNDNLIPANDTYTGGKQMAKVAQVVRIADQVGHPAARNHFLAVLKSELEGWFQAEDGDGKQFYYDSEWETLIGYPASFGSNTELNDHHFHYGYFIRAAATVAQYDSTWAADSNWGGMVNLLIRDANNWQRSDSKFPFLRSLDAYKGHSWAAGHGAFGDGNDQESSSESVNFAVGTFLWGAATGNETVRDLGIFLYLNEVAAVQQYWFDVDDVVFPEGYNHEVAGLIWGSKKDYATFFGANPEFIHGINMLPITSGSVYHQYRPNFLPENYNEATGGSACASGQTWRDILWQYKAMYDPASALRCFEDNPDYGVFNGESRAHTLHFISSMKTLGQLDLGVTADVPTYNVFEKNGARTHLAYNPTAAPITVNFSDGETLPVAPGEIATAEEFDGGPNVQQPFGGAPTALPDTLETEDFDEGGQGISYNDSDAANIGGAYRDTSGVDVEQSTEHGYDVTATAAGEWMEYMVDVEEAGDYDLTFRVASASSSGAFHLEVEDEDVTGTQSVPATTSGAQDWTNVTAAGIDLAEGEQVLRFTVEEGGFNLNYLAFEAQDGGGTPQSNELYLINGASPPDAAGTLSLTEGDGAATDVVPPDDGTAGGDSLVYRLGNVTGEYDDGQTQFSLWLDAREAVGQATEAQVAYDFTGDGTFDRVENFGYFPTDPIPDDFEEYAASATDVTGMPGDFADLNDGTIQIAIRQAFGGNSVYVRTSATSDEGQQSILTVPFELRTRTGEEPPPVLPQGRQLAPNYPNPFSGSTRIDYELPAAGFVRLTVYDVLGRAVQTLANRQQPAGRHHVRFDASELPGGVYLYRLRAGDFTATKRLTVMK